MNIKLTHALPLFVALFATFSLNGQAPGTLDPSFATVGYTTASFVTYAADSKAMVLQADGKVVLAGLYTAGGVANFAFARFNTNGTPDATFGTNGQQSVPISNVGVKLNAVQITTGGKILAAGANNNKPLLVRLNTNGTVDNTFGANGQLPFDGGLTGIVDLLTQTNGKIVGCGLADQNGAKVFAAFRLNADGTPDNTFGTAGFAYLDAGDNPTLTRMALQPDGKILMTGTVFFNTTKYDLVLARLNANGTPDTSFDTDGKVTTVLSTNSAYEQGNAIAVLPDGKIIVAGRIANAGPTVFAVVRYTAVGVKDNTFGANGFTTLNFNNGGDEAKAVAIQPDGKIVVVGSSIIGAARDLAVGRLNANGTPDNTFDADGKATATIGTRAYGEIVALQTNGRIMVGGYAVVNGLSQLMAARFFSGLTVATHEPESGLTNVSVFPNPATAGAPVNVTFILEQTQTGRFQLVGADGRLLQTWPAQHFAAGTQQTTITLPAGITPQTAVLQLHMEKGGVALPLIFQ